VETAPTILRGTRRARRERYQADPRYRWFVLTVLMVGVFSSAFPTTLLSASLPDIAQDLHTSTAVITWVQTAPAIAFAVGMPFFGKLGDLYGHRRAFIYGFLGVAVFAFLTAMAWNPGALIAFRSFGQMAGAATSTAAFGLIAAVFEREDRVRAIGTYTSVLAISPVIAVVAGGPLIDAVGWRLLFAFQCVLALVAVVAAVPILPETPRRGSIAFDIAGAVTLGIGVTALLFSINRGTPWGWTNPIVIAGFIVGPITLVLFTLVERRTATPLLPLDFFRRRNFSAALTTNTVLQMSYLGGFTIAPFMVHRLFGYSTYKTSLVIAVRPVFFSFGAWFASRGEKRSGLRFVQVAGSILLTLGTLVTALAAYQRSLWLMLIGLGVVGLGVGYGRPANTTSVTNSVDESDVGIATGVLNMTGQIGSAVGVTVLLALVGDSSSPSTFSEASIVAAAIAAVSIVTALTLRPVPKSASDL
jgi:MFS family permease